MNITASIAKDFRSFCETEFPGKKVQSGTGYIYVQAGEIFDTELHYEYYKEEIQLHCESDRACNLASFIIQNKIELPSNIEMASWQKTRYRWLLKKKITSLNELFYAFQEIRNIFEPIIDMYENMTRATKCSVSDLLNMNIRIPNYQRPYKWTDKNIDNLLNDILQAIKENRQFQGNFKYRIGSVILHQPDINSENFDIVDGQQRLISLTLLAKYLGFKFQKRDNTDYSILDKEFINTISQSNIFNNYKKIKEWFSCFEESDDIKDIKSAFLNAFSETLEVVLIIVNKESEAFQLFDSQNSRGKALEAHDLLKAYHLREMQNDPYEMRHVVERWEAIKSKDIRDLFKYFLFPILRWSQKEKVAFFTSKEIDVYKGIKEDSDYTYAKKIFKSMPYYQITEQFIAGECFFGFVDHYLNLLQDLITELKNSKNEYIQRWLNSNEKNTGFNYARNLFYGVFLCYYDRFHNFNPMVVKKLFTWAFMIRVDMIHLGEETIRKYAIGEYNAAYTNTKAVFKQIIQSRTHFDVANLNIEYKKDKVKSFEELYKDICKINGENNESDI